MKNPASVSILCFVLGASSSVFLLLKFISENLYLGYLSRLNYILPINYLFLNFAIHALTRKFLCQVGVRAAFLGFIFCLGIYVAALADETWDIFGWYLCCMAFFHYSEFLTIALTNPDSLSISSFILNHSTEYKVAAVSSWIEFFVELWIYPGMKTIRYVSLFGLLLCVCGEGLRKVAMITAKTNFNHIVQDERKEGHSLVTTGVYSLFRHPSYVGWFYWSIGTQLILLNPICIVAYTLASWKFFHDRVTIEEVTLLSFFGQAYVDYQKTVPTGLPFINGYTLNDE